MASEIPQWYRERIKLRLANLDSMIAKAEEMRRDENIPLVMRKNLENGISDLEEARTRLKAKLKS